MFGTLGLLLPALIPSWNFFDVIADSPRVEYALLRSPNQTVIGWHEFRPRPQRVSLPAMLGRLFWNARWNEALFVTSCAERLLAAPTVHSQDEIFRRIAADLADEEEPRAVWLTFRIVLLSEASDHVLRDVAFVSDPRPLAAIPVR